MGARVHISWMTHLCQLWNKHQAVNQLSNPRHPPAPQVEERGKEREPKEKHKTEHPHQGQGQSHPGDPNHPKGQSLGISGGMVQLRISNQVGIINGAKARVDTRGTSVLLPLGVIQAEACPKANGSQEAKGAGVPHQVGVEEMGKTSRHGSQHQPRVSRRGANGKARPLPSLPLEFLG